MATRGRGPGRLAAPTPMAGDNTPPLRQVSFNRRAKQVQPGGDRRPDIDPRWIRQRADEYFDETEYPTFNGLALALGFRSVSHWKNVVEDYYQKAANRLATADMLTRLEVWEVAQSRIQLHYEEGMQSAEISPQVGKFILEVLGFKPEQARDPEEDRAKAAAKAAVAGFQEAAKGFAKMTPGARKASADDIVLQ